jgi:hypothetical protein
LKVNGIVSRSYNSGVELKKNRAASFDFQVDSLAARRTSRALLALVP